jgi:pimeloyl-ACP methyl ester carboxylesterase
MNAEFRIITRLLLWSLALITLPSNISQAQSNPDASHHTVQFVIVEKDIKLEVLDWGGKGRPLIFLSGLGNTAHIFDQLAPKFTANYHVYGITRRGFGDSSKPAPTAANYSADRLGNDVLAVIAALKLNRPVLVGHSIAGEELSSVASRHPEKVSGIIYLDAADAYAFYDPAHGDWMLDMLDLKKQINTLESGAVLDQKLVQQMLASTAQLQNDLQDLNQRLALMPSPAPPPPPPIGLAIRFGEQKYTRISVPALAIFACPHNFDPMFRNASAAKSAMIANDRASCTAQADAFQAGVPSARCSPAQCQSLCLLLERGRCHPGNECLSLSTAYLIGGIMKHKITLCLASILLLTTISAKADNPQIAGVWKASLHNQPCIQLTVHDDHGKLSGNIIFYLLMLENGAWHVKSNASVPLIHPRIEGNNFVFEVQHAKKHGSTDPADQELKTFRMELAGKDKGIFRNAIEGQDLTLDRTNEER